MFFLLKDIFNNNWRFRTHLLQIEQVTRGDCKFNGSKVFRSKQVSLLDKSSLHAVARRLSLDIADQVERSANSSDYREFADSPVHSRCRRGSLSLSLSLSLLLCRTFETFGFMRASAGSIARFHVAATNERPYVSSSIFILHRRAFASLDGDLHNFSRADRLCAVSLSLYAPIASCCISTKRWILILCAALEERWALRSTRKYKRNRIIDVPSGFIPSRGSLCFLSAVSPDRYGPNCDAAFSPRRFSSQDDLGIVVKRSTCHAYHLHNCWLLWQCRRAVSLSLCPRYHAGSANRRGIERALWARIRETTRNRVVFLRRLWHPSRFINYRSGSSLTNAISSRACGFIGQRSRDLAKCSLRRVRVLSRVRYSVRFGKCTCFRIRRRQTVAFVRFQKLLRV